MSRLIPLDLAALRIALALLVSGVCCAPSSAAIIEVPGSQLLTIQQGINSASTGDTVLVSPGTYLENLRIADGITLASQFILTRRKGTVDSTIIDASSQALGPSFGGVIVIQNGTMPVEVVGFTLANGTGVEMTPSIGGSIPGTHGGAIFVYDRPVKIHHNLMTSNSATSGGGIALIGVESIPYKTALIDSNVFNLNSAADSGGAILVKRMDAAILNNVFVNSCCQGVWGHDIGIGYVGSNCTNIRNNTFWNSIHGPPSSRLSIGLNEVGACIDLRNCLFVGSGIGSGVDSTGIIAALHWDTTAISCWELVPANVTYNAFYYYASDSTVISCSDAYGDTSWGTNPNGTPVDSFMNILRNPELMDTIPIHDLVTITFNFPYFRLLPNSPCIDAGDPLYLDADGTISDIGAFFFNQGPCDCPSQCDFNDDGLRNAVDLNDEIDVLFFNGTDIQDSGCLTTRADFDADGFPDAVDLSLLIEHLFFNGENPCDPCSPVQSSCAP